MFPNGATTRVVSPGQFCFCNQAEKRVQLNHSTILIIGGDGSRRNRHAIELETHGYRVECAHSTQTAMQLYLAKPPALVLFALDEHDLKAWQVYRRLARDYPLQKKAFALSGSQRLCSVSVDSAELMKAQGPDDLIAAVVDLIGAARPITAPAERKKRCEVVCQ